jgi:hypothetical protein
MKIKIRKIEVTPEEFFDALTAIIIVHERIPKNKYVGSSLQYICSNIGIKPLEFWTLKFENEKEFESRFIISQAGFDNNFFYLWRKETYDSNLVET